MCLLVVYLVLMGDAMEKDEEKTEEEPPHEKQKSEWRGGSGEGKPDAG